MTELYLDGERMDVSPDTVIARTFQQNLLTSQGSVDSPYTNAFTLPFTKQNAKVLGNPEEPSSLTPTPYVKLDTVIRQDGIEQFPNAIAEVQAYEGGAYRVQVFAGSVPFFDLLGDRELKDLDFSNHTHTWDFASVAGGGEGGVYLYDLIDRGKLEGDTLHPSELYLSVYAKAIWDRIFSGIGVAYAMGPHADFEKLLLPFSNEKPVHSAAWLETHVQSAQLVKVNSGSNLYDFYRATVPVTQHGKLRATFKAKIKELPYTREVAFTLRQGDREQTKRHTIAAKGEYTLEQAFEVEVGRDLTGLEVSVQVSVPVIFGQAAFFEYGELSTAYEEEAYFGTEWDIALNLPEMDQKDFILALCKLFGWSLVYEPYSATMQVKPLHDVALNLAKATDWTHKIDYSATPKMAYRLPDTARNNLYLWEEDETVPSGLGDGVIMASNEHLEEKREAVEMPFAASEERNGLLYLPVFGPDEDNLLDDLEYDAVVETIPARDTIDWGIGDSGKKALVLDATADPAITRGWAVYIFVSTNRRWFLLNKQTWKRESISPRLSLLTDNTRTFTLKQGNTTQTVTRPLAGFAGLHFDVLLPKYHSVLQRVLSRVQLITVPVLLSAQDFAQLDSTVPIWVDRFNDYYYLNKITDYVSAAIPCEAELIKLN